ncbi:MAG: polysaccharide export protein Wza [Pedosphaera sp.]|nr:polysaccharide export protein Wza [Pedosphaera sp.]
MKNHSSRWWTLSALLLMSIGRGVQAEDQTASTTPQATVTLQATAAGVTSTNPAPAAIPPGKRAQWQQHLTLGPGDTMSFALYLDNKTEQVRENLIVGPDGRISYLQAQDILATGLTIDELRAKMDAVLGTFYRSPHTIITPVAIRSKKYFVLGSVVTKGVFTFDRPMTLIEAIARSGGLETGVFERNTVELADLSHSFLIRQGQRVPLDFEKLFQQGDLSQNIPLEPNDYLYFASASANEIYVLGEVQVPGTVPFTPSASVIGAITTRGSFTTRAFRGRVLIVRGSLSHPETFVVNTGDILDGKAVNFRLKPRDIIYVAVRPWQKAEDLLDMGTRAFIEAVVVTYTGVKVGPFIDPLIH